MADRMIECPRCNGLSRNDGTASLSCSRCGSSGTIPDRRKPSEIEDALRAEVARQIKGNESLAEANLTYAMETKELRDEVERLKVAEGEAMLVVESQDASIAALKAELAKYTEPLTYEQAAIVCNDYRLGVLTEGDVDEIDAAIRRVRGER